jgi:hypothetical protein
MGADYTLPIGVTCVFSRNSLSPVSDATDDGAANNNNNNNNYYYYYYYYWWWWCNISTLLQVIYNYVPETNQWAG